jgi:hypothetical protein
MISGRSRKLGRYSLALAVAVGADRLRDCLRMYPEVSGTAVETTARDELRKPGADRRSSTKATVSCGRLDPRPTAPSDEEERSGRRPPRMDRTGQLGAAALERMREPGGRDQAAGGRLLVVRSGRVADRESGARTGPKSSAARRSVRAVPVAAGRTRALLPATRVGCDSLLDTHFCVRDEGRCPRSVPPR